MFWALVQACGDLTFRLDENILIYVEFMSELLYDRTTTGFVSLRAP